MGKILKRYKYAKKTENISVSDNIEPRNSVKDNTSSEFTLGTLHFSSFCLTLLYRNSHLLPAFIRKKRKKKVMFRFDF